MTTKIDTHYGSIWDELPKGTERKIPTTQREAMDFYEAAQSSMDKAVLKTMDGHNDMMKKSAELRKISQRKKAVEDLNIKHREEQRKFFEDEAKKKIKA